MNKQPIEKRVRTFDGLLEVHSVFYTIQGEGPFTGTPCVFVRLAGCNLQCPGCDTDYTSKRVFHGVQSLIARITNEFDGRGDGRRLVVITGGEPFRQDLTQLLIHLPKLGFYVQIETNGSFELPLGLPFNQNIGERRGVYVVCSPKTPTIHNNYHIHACAFKYVLDHGSVDPEDGLPHTVLDNHTGRKVARPKAPFMGEIYLQPMDHGSDNPISNRKNVRAVVRSCLQHGYLLQLQIHKLIGVE